MSDNTSTAPPRVPVHGNGLLRPWQAGESGNPGGRSAAEMEARHKLHKAFPRAVKVGIELVESTHDRVRAVAMKEIFDRVRGKPKDTPMPLSDDRGSPDRSALTPEQRRVLSAALATVRQILGSVPHIVPAKDS